MKEFGQRNEKKIELPIENSGSHSDDKEIKLCN